MTAKAPFTVVVDARGTTRGIYTDAVEAVFKDAPKLWVSRASHVETTADLSPAARQAIGNVPPGVKWWADLSPSGGPVLGPFDTRAEALAAEVQWLKDQRMPLPISLRD